MITKTSVADLLKLPKNSKTHLVNPKNFLRASRARSEVSSAMYFEHFGSYFFTLLEESERHGFKNFPPAAQSSPPMFYYFPKILESAKGGVLNEGGVLKGIAWY